MALDSHEQTVWEACLKDLESMSYFDHIERAAVDCRMTDNLKAIYDDDPTAKNKFRSICNILLHDYMLNPEELSTAIGIAEDRINHD